MLMGKGGVGKTTIATAIAAELAGRGHDVLLTTTDPAAHLTETLREQMAHLTVSRIDPAEETARYRRDVLESKGKDLDSEARACSKKICGRPAPRRSQFFRPFRA